MTPPWQTLATVETSEGPLELRRRGDTDFQIVVGGRVAMTSSSHRSQDALARFAAGRLAGRAGLRVLIGGLGMGYSLRAALDAFPADARVTVAERRDAIAEWCRGPLAVLTQSAAADPRVTVVVDDFTKVIARTAASREGDDRGGSDAVHDAAYDAVYDAILLDLNGGPTAATRKDDPLYGAAALTRSHTALAPGGVMTVWAQDPEAAFAKRFAAAGFAVTTQRAAQGGRTHVVYLGVRR
jgi:spermidine synthase